MLKVLKLPERVRGALRDHSAHGRVRAYFVKKRLQQMVTKMRSETAMLREIKRVIGAGG